ncbi:MAG TPA: divalent-cation tolerance protein CutA [Pyrinomonadaceae bacterium]|nr:divalent-cation tolerance protein CutA [Pyrinomonadaceae bacterium]
MNETISESEPIVVLMTAASSEEATRIADALVAHQLAACVQLLPEMNSIYIWKGEVQRDKEVLMLAKTTRGKFEQLEWEVRALHSYETPEIIALPIVAGSQDYLEWLISSGLGS